MDAELKEVMVFILKTMSLLMNYIGTESVEDENEWVELESDIIKLIKKLEG